MSVQTELFRIAATIGRSYLEDAAGKAALQILDWAANGLSKPLPKQASDLESFKHFERGASLVSARILEDDRDVWALRVDKTDATGPHHIRSTEAVVQRHAGKRNTLTVRQMVDGYPRYDSKAPSTPSFVHKIDGELGLYSLWEKLESTPWLISSEEECQRMIGMLVDSTRMWPAFVLTVPQDSANAFQPLLDPLPLARATTGLARVVVLPHQFTWDLTNRFGKELSVYLGAVRVYQPGFHERADPWAHELVLSRRLETEHERAMITAKLQRVAAESSLQRFELGRDIAEFSSLRKEASELARSAAERQAQQPRPVIKVKPPSPPQKPPVKEPEPTPPPVEIAPAPAPVPPPAPPPSPVPAPPEPAAAAAKPEPSDANGSESASKEAETPSEPPRPVAASRPVRTSLFGRIFQFLLPPFRKRPALDDDGAADAVASELQAGQERIKALEAKVQDVEAESKWLSDEHAAMETRAQAAEAELEQAKVRIRELEGQLALLKVNARSGAPRSWSEFSSWCERSFSGKIMFSERAKREVKKPKFKDVAAAAKGISWLANEYRAQRLSGGGGDLRGPNSSGLSNEPCGGTRFTIPWGGKQMDVKWHLKNGGNTHDPTRCLRIYYFWDDTNKQVVVASMPGHYRVTGR